MTTISDIAKRIGVSPATVSRVLNGYPDVKATTRQKVEQAIAELGYNPGALSRVQHAGKSMAIGVFYTAEGHGALSHPFFQDVLDAFKEATGAVGYDLLFFSVDSSEDRKENFKFRAQKRNLDAVLLVSIPRTDRRIGSLAIGDIPCMSIDLDLVGARAGYVCSDNLGGAIQAVEYLVSMGHTNIAYIGDKFGTKPGHDRMLGYQQTLQSHRLTFRPEWVLDGDFSEVGGYEAARTLLYSDTPPSAIFCAGDLMAIGAMRAIREGGLEVGEDVSVLGFDDLPVAAYVTPALTTIRQRRRDMGRSAAESLIRMIEDPQSIPPVIMVPTELVVRDSVKQPRVQVRIV